MEENLLKVGDLASRTGLSIRTLHHYDEIGLLSPQHRTASGHRLYAETDVARLQQILSLRQLGFALKEIRTTLARPDHCPREVITAHVGRLKTQIETQRRLCQRLESLAGHLAQRERVSVKELLDTIKEIELMEQFEKYYAPQQLEYLEQRRGEVGEDRMQQVQHDWQELFEQFRAEMKKGTDPADERVQRLAKRRDELVREFTGGRADIAESLRNAYGKEPALRQQVGMEPDLAVYMNQASEASK